MEIGRRIRLLRKQQQRTQNDIAARCGFTVSLLSKIENGQTTPPVATLMKIANALGVKVSDLLEPEHPPATVFVPAEHHRDAARWIKTDRGYSFFAFASARGDKAMQPYLFTARKGETTDSPLSHSGEEFLFVLSGEMRYRVGNVEYTLKAGDSLYFNSLEDHSLQPVTDEVTYLAVIAEH